VDVPETRYAKTPDGVSIAYQVVGDGPVDIVYSSGIWSNLEMMWEHPPWARFLRRLSSFSRLIVFDMRGVGLSDRGPEPPVIELQRDDIAAVMDAADARTAIVFGGARAGSMAILFAATHPERTQALILYAPVAKTVSTPDFPHGRSPAEQQAFFERFVREVGGHYLQVLDERPRGRDPVPDDYRRMGRLLSELGRRTADLGIRLGLHNHMGNLGQAPDEVARVLDAADPRFVHLELDTAHYQQAGGDPADAVRRYADRLLFLHLKDLDASHRFVELGRGKVDFKAVFAALDEVSFDGWGVVELDAVPDPARTPKESGAIARRYLEALGIWNDAS